MSEKKENDGIKRWAESSSKSDAQRALDRQELIGKLKARLLINNIMKYGADRPRKKMPTYEERLIARENYRKKLNLNRPPDDQYPAPSIKPIYILDLGK